MARFLRPFSRHGGSVYRPRHPERTVLYRVLFHYFDRFLAEYEGRFEKDYGFLRPIIKKVVERYLDCGNPRSGFARIRCPDCGEERLLMFSCRTRGFCPSCHAKRLEEWGEWMRETLLLDVPHRQVVFTIPKMLRLFFKYNRRLLGSLCRCALRSLARYFEIVAGHAAFPLRIAEEELQRLPAKGWAEMIRKVYEVDPLTCTVVEGANRPKNDHSAGAAEKQIIINPGQKKTMPAFNRTIVFDEAGNLWIDLYKEDTTKEFTYDVFSPEGIYLKQVRIDQRIFQFKNGKVYSIVRPEDGYPSIKRFLMELVAE